MGFAIDYIIFISIKRYYIFMLIMIFIFSLIYEIFLRNLKNEKDLVLHNPIIFIAFSILYIYYMKGKNLKDFLFIVLTLMMLGVVLYIFLFLVKLVKYISKSDKEKEE